MGKILIIAVAAVVGAVATWFFVPTMQPSAAPGSAMQLEPINMEERRARAAKLIGKPLRYLTDDFARDFNWFWKQGPDAIDIAMDECELLMDGDLFARHVAAMAEQGITVKQGPFSNFANPPLAQAKTCTDLTDGYSRLIGRKYPF